MLTRALHANALALSRALRFPAPEKADSLESAAAAVTAAHREELRSPANKQPLASPSAAKAKRPAADPAWTGGPRPPPGSYLTDPGPPRSGAPRASFAAIQASMLAPPPPPPPPPAQWHSTVWDALNQKLSKADDDPLARREVVSSTRLRAAARSATPPPPGATPLYISYASRGAATEQQRREFDKAARGAGQQKRAKFPTSKAPISAVSHSFRLIFGRAIISRNGLEAWMLFPERARAEHSC